MARCWPAGSLAPAFNCLELLWTHCFFSRFLHSCSTHHLKYPWNFPLDAKLQERKPGPWAPRGRLQWAQTWRERAFCSCLSTPTKPLPSVFEPRLLCYVTLSWKHTRSQGHCEKEETVNRRANGGLGWGTRKQWQEQLDWRGFGFLKDSKKLGFVFIKAKFKSVVVLQNDHLSFNLSLCYSLFSQGSIFVPVVQTPISAAVPKLLWRFPSFPVLLDS